MPPLFDKIRTGESDPEVIYDDILEYLKILISIINGKDVSRPISAEDKKVIIDILSVAKVDVRALKNQAGFRDAGKVLEIRFGAVKDAVQKNVVKTYLDLRTQIRDNLILPIVPLISHEAPRTAAKIGLLHV